MGKDVDRTGHRFGVLTAIEPTYRWLSSGRRMPAWKLRCDCGAEVVAMTGNLVNGKHQSCGCKKGELNSARYRGDTKLPEYRVYRQMLDRCYLPAAKNFKYYGAEGVTVCDRWHHGADAFTGFQCFMADMGARPEGLTLDRKDPRKPYEPDNCRWATKAEQANNRRNTPVVMFRGEPTPLGVLAKRYGLRTNTLWMRVMKYGWDVEVAVSTPVAVQSWR